MIRRSRTVAGARISYLLHGRRRSRSLILVHGGAAHCWWWSLMIGQMTSRYTVAALDLSGHGDSARRPEYTPELWAEEVAAVADDLTSEGLGLPVVVGHSMGGRVAAVLGARFDACTSGLIIVETHVRRPGVDRRLLQPWPPRQLRVYPTRNAIKNAFRLEPDQPLPAATRDAIAKRSIRRVEGGWSWKHDPSVFGRFTDELVADSLRQAPTPMGQIIGDRSLFRDDRTTDVLRELRGAEVPIVVVQGGYHHLPLDHPSETAEAIIHLADLIGS